MTRRQALAMGAAAGVTATIGVPAESVAAAGATLLAGPGPEYLRRSTYVDLVGEEFTTGGHSLWLLTVGDVLGADFDPGLKGHESAFSLQLQGPPGALGSDIHELTHPLLGPFPIFIGPAGPARGATQAYDVTVDRSVRVTLADAPEPAPSILRPAEVTLQARGEDQPEPSEPTPRDLEIVEARRMAAALPIVMRRRRTRRASRKLRRSLEARVRFKRKQRARMHRVRTGWLRRHGR